MKRRDFKSCGYLMCIRDTTKFNLRTSRIKVTFFHVVFKTGFLCFGFSYMLVTGFFVAVEPVMTVMYPDYFSIK